MPSQPEEGEIPEASIPPIQEEPPSPSVSKKHKRIKIKMKKRKRINKILVPNPSNPKNILEEEEDGEVKDVMLGRSTWDST